MPAHTRSKFPKVVILLLLLIVIIISIILISEGSNFFTKNKELIPDHIHKVPTEYGVDLHVKQGKIVLTNNVSPNKDGSKAVINAPSQAIVIVDPQGNSIDDLQDLHKGMESMKVNKGSKHVPAFLTAGHFFGENHFVFLSNYTEDDPRANLWIMDLETREFKKLFDAATFGDMFFKYFSQEKLMIWTEKEDTYYMIYPDETYEAIDINGRVLRVSPDGEIIAYMQYRMENGVRYSENEVRFLNVNDRSFSIQPEVDLPYRYNGNPTWNESGNKFALFVQTVKGMQILVFDFATEETTFIPWKNKPFNSNSSFQFITDTVIQVEFEDESKVQYSIE